MTVWIIVAAAVALLVLILFYFGGLPTRDNTASDVPLDAEGGGTFADTGGRHCGWWQRVIHPRKCSGDATGPASAGASARGGKLASANSGQSGHRCSPIGWILNPAGCGVRAISNRRRSGDQNERGGVRHAGTLSCGPMERIFASARCRSGQFGRKGAPGAPLDAPL